MGSSLASTPVVQTPRRETTLTEADYEAVGRESGEVVWRKLHNAMDCGDRVAIRRLVGAYLHSHSTSPVGVGRDRLILTGAAAHADYVEVRTLGDLPAFLLAVRSEIEVMQLSDGAFGLRRPGTLDNPFAVARARIAATIEHVDSLLNGRFTPTGLLVRGLSYMGDFPLAKSVADALVVSETTRMSQAVLGGHLRRLHVRPDLAQQYLEVSLSANVTTWSLNSMSGALCDLDRPEEGIVFASRSLGRMRPGMEKHEVREREYTAHTMSRPLRLMGLTGLRERTLRIARLSTKDEAPRPHVPADVSALFEGAYVLRALGMGDLSLNLLAGIRTVDAGLATKASRLLETVNSEARMVHADGVPTLVRNVEVRI